MVALGVLGGKSGLAPSLRYLITYYLKVVPYSVRLLVVLQALLSSTE